MALIRDQIRLAFRKDGGDHVNLSVFGETAIGQLASPEYRKRFFIPHLGEFASPRCFANWMSSMGNEQLRSDHRRYDTKGTPVTLFRSFLLYAKFYQILAIRATYNTHKEMLSLPWVMYKSLTGVKEFDRWDQYPEIVKAMVSHIVSNDTRVKFDWDQFVPGLLARVNDRIRMIAENAGEDPDSVVDISEADDVAKQRKLAHKEQQAKQKAERQQQEAAKAPEVPILKLVPSSQDAQSEVVVHPPDASADPSLASSDPEQDQKAEEVQI